MVWRDKVTLPVDFPLRGLDLTHKHLAAAVPPQQVAAAEAAAAAAAVAEAEARGAGGDDAAISAAGGAASTRAYDEALAAAPPVDAGWTPEPAVYDAVGVVNHFGSMMFGHYTAFANHGAARDATGRTPGTWYNFDDSSVSRAKPSDIASPAAYIVVYRRRRGAAGGAGGAAAGGAGDDAASGDA